MDLTGQIRWATSHEIELGQAEDRAKSAEKLLAERTADRDRLAAELAAAREREAGLRERLRQELVDNLSEETAKWEQLGNHPGAREARHVAVCRQELEKFDAESAALSATPAGEVAPKHAGTGKNNP